MRIVNLFFSFQVLMKMLTPKKHKFTALFQVSEEEEDTVVSGKVEVDTLPFSRSPRHQHNQV